MGATSTSGTSVTSITGYSMGAGARIGSNGDDGGDWEYMVGGAAGTGFNTGRMTWDANPTDSISTDDVATSLTTVPGGGTNGVSWTVTGGVTVPITFTLGTVGAISSVKMRALVRELGCYFSWTDVSVAFYKNGSLVETIPYSPIVADTTAGTAPTKEQIVTFTPTNNDNTAVVITATLALTYGDVDIDSPDAIWGQIYVFSA